MIWENNLGYLYGISENFNYKQKIASFDIDGTIISTKSGKVFPVDYKDWKFLYENIVLQTLQDYYKKGYCIIFITNQGGLKNEDKKKDWIKKINNVVKEIGVPVCIFASIDIYLFRKPLPSIWNIIKTMVLVSNESFYCGDAAGRDKDHNDTDYKFALNCYIKFMTPEMFFLGELKNEHWEIKYPNLAEMSTTSYYKFVPSKTKELIILVGFPGSGKSSMVEKYLEPNEYMRISHDILKTKKKCLDETEKYMKLSKNIVIDNLNYSREMRKIYIDIAKKYNYDVRCIILDTSYDVSKHNMLYRYYKSGGKIGRVPDLVYNKMRKNMELPCKDEGIKIIENIGITKPDNVEYNYYMY